MLPFEHADILDSQNVYIPDETLNPYQVMTYLGPGNTMSVYLPGCSKTPEWNILSCLFRGVRKFPEHHLSH